MKDIEGQLNASDLRIGFVVSRFNSTITERLLKSALGTVKTHGGRDENMTVVHVPGSFEIPMAALKMAETKRFDAVVCLGCLIRGETDHYDHLAREVTRGISEVALRCRLPVTYGLITADTVEQAQNRSGIKYGNKGADAALAAIEMVQVFRLVDEA